PSAGPRHLLTDVALRRASDAPQIAPAPTEIDADSLQHDDRSEASSPGRRHRGSRPRRSRPVEGSQGDSEGHSAYDQCAAHDEEPEPDAGTEHHADDHDGLRATNRSGTSMRAMRSMPTSDTAKTAPMTTSTSCPPALS